MTLILSVLTHQYVIQVSDRRLVTLPNFVLADDESVKSVIQDNHTTYAFTGLARLPRSEAVQAADGGDLLYRDTAIWLGELLGHTPPTLEAALETVRTEAERSMRRTRLTPHAFLGVGWRGVPLRPHAFRAWNYANGRAASEFRAMSGYLDKKDPLGWYSSKPFARRLEKRFARQLRACVAANRTPATVARIMRSTIRDVASRDRSVGRGLIEVCLPRAPVEAFEAERPWGLSTKEANLEHATIRVFPADKEQADPTVSPVTRLGLLLAETVILHTVQEFRSINNPKPGEVWDEQFRAPRL